jgi:hypothetical protein
MLITEKEAKTKWCPMVRHESPIGEGYGSFNRGGANDAVNTMGGKISQYSCACLGSGCMMWVWGYLPDCREITADCSEEKAPSRPRNIPTTWKYVLTDERTHRLNAPVMVGRWVEPDAERDARRPGYCGLVGDGGQEYASA